MPWNREDDEEEEEEDDEEEEEVEEEEIAEEQPIEPERPMATTTERNKGLIVASERAFGVSSPTDEEPSTPARQEVQHVTTRHVPRQHDRVSAPVNEHVGLKVTLGAGLGFAAGYVVARLTGKSKKR